MRSKLLAAASAVGLTAALSLAVPHAAAAHAAMTVFPSGHSAPWRTVNLRTAPRIASHAVAAPNLTRNHPSTSAQAGIGAKPAADGVSPQVRVTAAKFDGLTQTTPGCSCSSPPEPQVAAGATQIVEVVSGALAVYDRSGARQYLTNLNTLLGTTASIHDAHLLFDPIWNRYVIVVTADAIDTAHDPTLYTAVSASSDPSGTWYVSGLDVYWAGSGGDVVDAQAGLSRDAILVSSDQYTFDGTNFSYANSYAFAIPKDIAYNNLGLNWNSLLFAVNYETVPATVMGNPTPDPKYAFLISPDSNTDSIHVYAVANAADYGRQQFKALPDAPYAWDVPQRPANQPGTTAKLSVGSGRITGMVSQIGSRLWFTHGVDLGGYPGVSYGFVTSGAHPRARMQYSYHSLSSDDFDPSLTAISDASNHTHVFLNWAYTDAPNNVPLRDVWDLQNGINLQVHPGIVYSNTPGASSSEDTSTITGAAPDYYPGCGGTRAVVANQYFAAAGTWRTRIAEVGNC